MVSIVDLLFLLDYFVPLQVFHLFLFTFVQLLLDVDIVKLQLVFTFIFWLFNSIAFAFYQVIALVSISLLFISFHSPKGKFDLLCAYTLVHLSWL